MIRTLSLILLFGCATTASARTIELSDTDCTLIAGIDPQITRHGWASSGGRGAFHNMYVNMDGWNRRGGQAFLIQFPLDQIPKDMRIVHAELTMPVQYLHPPQRRPRIQLRRIVGAWGVGVNYEYRMQRPKKIKWSAPGALAMGKDRARRPSVVVRIKEPKNTAVDVTQDVELWASGTVKNCGWIITLDEDRAIVRFASPTWTPGSWKLRVTFEPR